MILQQHKIVFAGTMGAGKSAAIQTISEIDVLSTEAKNTDTQRHEKLLTTVGIDYGEITLEDGIKIGLYGLPGQERFDFMWSVICQGAVGCIVLIDHSNADAIKSLEFYINQFKQYGLNLVIGVTHLDEIQHLGLNQYQAWLDEAQINLPLFFIDARKKQDVLLMIEALIAQYEAQLMTPTTATT